MKAIYIYGAGGHGAVVAEIAHLLGYDILGFVDDNSALTGKSVLDWKVLGTGDLIPDGATVALGIGDNVTRAALTQRARDRKWSLPVLVHPSAIISPSAVLGAGTVVMAQVAVNARARIGEACILNTSCSVDHDCSIGCAVHIAPGVRLAGSVTVGDRTLVGIGSCARPGVCIGCDCIIGAGSVVVCDIPDYCVAYGNPARPRA
ncbi:MAG: acetyltransferase [Armatimonadota bacterium]|nr:acetyltransferase [Armatimonadota bacterium]